MPTPLPAEAIRQAARELDVALVVKAADNGFRAPEATQGLYEEAVTPAVIAALNAIDKEWLLSTVLGITEDQLRRAMRPHAAVRAMDCGSELKLPQATPLHNLLLVRGGDPSWLPDGRSWLAVALRAYADLIEQS